MNDKSAEKNRANQNKAYAVPQQKGLSAYQQMTSAQKKSDMVRKNLALVKFVAARLAIGLPEWIDIRDLINAGVIGLIEAVNNFDPGRGVKFETFAKLRIKGAIIDELRSLDWIPRSTRTKSKEIEKAIVTFINRTDRFPTDEETAAVLGWDLDKYYKTVGQVSVTTLLSLDEIVSGSTSEDSIKRIDTISTEDSSALDSMEKKELVSNVVKILSSLSEQERLVIALYYYEELTLKEIGLVLKVTESRVSQIHTMSIIKLRAKLHSIYGKQ